VPNTGQSREVRSNSSPALVDCKKEGLPWQICGRCDWREADRKFKRRPKGTESVT